MAEPRILPCFLDISVHISTIVITGLIDQTIRPALFFVRLRATPSRLLGVLGISFNFPNLRVEYLAVSQHKCKRANVSISLN